MAEVKKKINKWIKKCFSHDFFVIPTKIGLNNHSAGGGFPVELLKLLLTLFLSKYQFPEFFLS